VGMPLRGGEIDGSKQAGVDFYLQSRRPGALVPLLGRSRYRSFAGSRRHKSI
jgi:hypothetical protein